MPNQHILLVEEHHKERTVLSKALEDWGYHVTTAHDGQAALKKIRSEQFRLVISSFDMPGLSGAELLCQAKSQK